MADPPWHYDRYASMPGDPKRPSRATKVVGLPYHTMTVAEISHLPVRRMADESGARLFLWTTNRYLPDSFAVMTRWGFEYQQTLVWHKTGNPSPFGGSIAPNHAEFLIVGSLGHPKTLARLYGSVIAVAKPYEHSRKPDHFIDLIEQVSPGPYVELFSRRHRLGWSVWGTESANTATLETA